MRGLVSSSALVAVGLVGHSCAQTRDAASQRALTDPVQECTPYNVAPFSNMVSSFPTVWTIASIPAGDSVAQALFAKISPGIPDIAPRGTPDYNLTAAVAAYNPADNACWWTYKQCTTPKFAGLQADTISCPEPSTWGLTFDDGPNCTHNAFYDSLRQNNQKATLFYIGSNVLIWPLQAQAGINDGHSVCAHSWSHRAMCALSNEQVFAELYYSKLAIKNVLGVTTQCWRPPYGDVDDRVRYIAMMLGMSTILWDNNVFDYQVSTIGEAQVQSNYQAIFSNATAGAFATKGTIVLSHELNNQTMSIFESNYGTIKRDFQHVEPMHVCQNITSPYLETNYVYPNHAQYAAGTTSVTAPTASASLVTSLNGLPAATASISTISNRVAATTGSAMATAAGPGVAGQTAGAGAAANAASNNTQKAGAVRLPVVEAAAIVFAVAVGAAAVAL